MYPEVTKSVWSEKKERFHLNVPKMWKFESLDKRCRNER